MPRVLSCCGGFLLAVLWMDLMFDVQVRAHPSGLLPEEVASSIAAYYARVTTGAYPMNRVIGAVMLVTLFGVLHQLLRGSFPLWLRVLAAACGAFPVSLALFRIFPKAMALASRADSLELQSDLARSIFVEHVVCALLMLVFVGIQLSVGGTRATAPASSRS